MIRRAPTYIIYPGGAMVLTYGSIKLAADATAAEDYSHRPWYIPIDHVTDIVEWIIYYEPPR